MTPSHIPDRVALPDALRRQLRGFERRLCRMEAVVGIFGGLCGILLTLGLLFCSDRLWNTPIWLRGSLTAAGGAGMAAFAFTWVARWWWRRRDTRALARLVQKRYSRMGDRLLGAVELADETATARNMSPALCRAAIRQVAREAAAYDFEEAVPTRNPRTCAVLASVLAVLIAVPFLLFPEAGCNTALRWAKPFAPVERYTFVSIEDLPREQIVPHGESFELACRLAPGSRWRPERATCRIAEQPEVEAAIENGVAVFRVPGQTAPGLLVLRIGDVTRRILVKPVFRPELRTLTAEVALPDYLERDAETVAIEGGRIRLLEGSTAAFAGAVSRALRSATMRTAPPATNGTAPSAAPAPPTRELNVAAQRFLSMAIAADALQGVVFEWTDRFGLTPASPYGLDVVAVRDEPPFVECRGPARAVAILQDEVVEFDVYGEDDYGLRSLWVNWSSEGDKERGRSALRATRTVTNGAPDALSLSGRFSFSPLAAHVPEETLVTLHACGADYYPDRKPAISLVYRIYVLSRTQHAKLLQRQMEALQARLEDLGRDEEELLDTNRGLDRLAPEALADDRHTRSLKEGAASEREHAERLSRIAESGEDLLQEALRNKDIPEETLLQWAERMNALKQLAGTPMQQAARSLQQAGAGKPQRREHLQQAIEQEEQILAALREAAQTMNQSLEDMLARNFVNRLLTAAAAEDAISASLREWLPVTIGMQSENLPAGARKEIERQARRQTHTQQEAGAIRDDLAGFYVRTRIPCYDAVQRDMVEQRTTERLGELAQLIDRNIGIQSIEQSTSWAQQFRAWAERLRDAAARNGCRGAHCRQPGEVDLEVLIALMRARRREESLREQTRLLEREKASNRAYAADARTLSEQQYELADDMRPLERKVRQGRLRTLIQKVGGEMTNAGMYLNKPQTDSATIAIQTEIIELLSASMSACMGQGGGMARMLMQSMGMSMGMGAGAGPAGGGSSAGGTTARPNRAAAGTPAGGPAEAREVEKVGGRHSSDVPAEFRDLLDAYYDALEENR